MSIDNLQDLFFHTLRDTYDAEKRLIKALPRMASAASSDSLRSAFEEHLDETEEHVARLERVFEMLDKSPRGKRCAGIIGLIDEGSELLREDGHSAALDAGLILAGQKVEHYEIAAYGTLASYAEILDMQDALPLLKQTLAEEKHADETLSQLAMSINSAAEMSQPHAE